MAAASRWAMGMQLDILAVQIILAVSFWGPIVDSWTRGVGGVLGLLLDYNSATYLSVRIHRI